MSLYLLINTFSIIVPLILSFDKRVDFAGSWCRFFQACFLTCLVFIPWDMAFTEIGIWGFSDKFTSGYKLFGLPFEELQFFIFIPFACTFTYEVINFFFKNTNFNDKAKTISKFIVFASTLIAVFNLDKAYTFTAFISLAITLTMSFLIPKFRFDRFFISYLFLLLPFFIVNGILTGFGLSEPVVWYNDAENLGIRILTIPLDDFFYGMSLILMNIAWYEALKKA